jgi:hypothetical protein
MGWKPSGHPTVRRQCDKWVVRVEGFDTETGRRRPRQLGAYASQRTAQAAARSLSVNSEWRRETPWAGCSVAMSRRGPT